MTDRNCTTSSAPNQTKRYTTESFIEKAMSVHGDRYDYSKAKLINMSCSVIITCKKHGDFYQGAGIHSRGSGCQKCFSESRGIKIDSTKEGFIRRSKVKHGDLFLYDNVVYKNTRTDVLITCRRHGDFKIKPASHIAGTGCPECKSLKKMNTQKFIRKSISIHGVRYDYRLTDFKSYKDGVYIICLHHGAFKQSVNNHLSGSGCPKCANLRSGWSRTDFSNYCRLNNDGMGTLYVIKCYLEDEVFYKVGITSKSIKSRFPSKKDMPYDYDVVYEVVDDGCEIYDLENSLLRIVKGGRYMPKLDFRGKHECFSNLLPITKYLSSLSVAPMIDSTLV